MRIRRRAADDCGNSWHNDCWPPSPVGEPFSPLGPSSRRLTVQQARWESRYLPTDAGWKSQSWPGTSAHGMDTGPEHSITRPIERPWSSSAGTIAPGRH